MMDESQQVLPTTVYTSSDSGDTDGATTAMLGTGCLVFLAMCIAPLCFAVTGIVFLVTEHSHIPSCAPHYFVYCIVMTALTGLSANNSKDTERTLEFLAKILEGGPCFSFFVSLLTALVPVLTYFLVVAKSGEGCDMSGMHKLYIWVWCIIWYWSVISGLILLVSMFKCVCR